MKFDFGNANDKQKEAIVTTEGPLLIIAGPGTGKTFTLVKRIAYLIVEKKVDPKNIMAVTFTEKAAKELISRITDELIKYNIQIDVNEMYVGTFHQICLKIIKEFREEAGVGKNYNMLDDFETKYFIYRNLKEFDDDDVENLFDDEKDIHKNWSKADKVLYVCSKIIEEIEEPDELLMDSDEEIESVGQIVKTYRELLSKENTLDFSSILFYCYNLLKSNEGIRKITEDRIKYIIVDEYQDTNKIQEKILSDMLGFQQDMEEEQANLKVATSYMMIMEHLMLFTIIRLQWENKDSKIVSDTLFIKDGPLILGSQFAKLVPYVRDFIKFAYESGRPIHIIGCEKSGTFFDYLDTVSKFIKSEKDVIKYAIPTHEYIRKEIQRVPDREESYGYRTNWGEKVFVMKDRISRYVLNIPPIEYKKDKNSPIESDIIGLDRILETIPSIIGRQYEGALYPITLANSIASLSNYPSSHILAKFTEAKTNKT